MRRNMNPSDRTTLLRMLDADELSDPEIRRLALFDVLAPERLHQVSHQALAARVTQRRAHPFASRDLPQPLIPGQLRFGTRPSGDPAGIDEADLAKHLLAVGQSGAGKTTLFYNLLCQMDVSVWCFDLKQDYRHLSHELDDLLVLPWTELKFNPLQPPPGVPPRRWAQVVSEIFGHATALLSGSKNHLLKTIFTLYRLYGVFDDPSPPYPSPHELEQLLAAERINYVRKTANYRDTVLNRIEAMNLGAGTIFDCSQGYNLEALLERNVVFEFDGLTRDTQNFVMEALLAAVYEYRLAQTQRSTDLNHVFVLDEAKQIFSVYKERQDAAGIPAIDELTAKLREFGEGLIVGDQEASKLTDSIKANTYTKVLLPTGDRKQFRAITESMSLTDRQQTVAQEIDIGEAIVQTGNDEPRRLSLDQFELAKDITDADLHRDQGGEWAALSAEPRARPERFLDALQAQGNGESTDPEIIDDSQSEISLSEEGDHLLKDVVEYPFVPLMERYGAFSSEYIGHRTKTELVEAGVVTEQTVRTGTGEVKLLELTERGRAYAETTLGVDPEHAGRGGIVHRYWQHQVKDAFERAGWTAKLELFDADVYVNTGEFELVIEIAMENSQRECEHVAKHLEREFDVIWVVCRTAAVRDGLQQRLADADCDTDRLTFRVVDEVADGDDGADDLDEWL